VPAERYHLLPRIERPAAEARVRAAISEGAFRPTDAGAARVDELVALVVPFWRLDVTRTDDTLTLHQTKIGSFDVPIPGARTHNARATWMVCARTAFPYEMKKAGALLKWDVEPLVVTLAALVPGDPPASPGWEPLDADVPEALARRQTRAALEQMAQGDEVVTTTELTVHAVHFVRYPIWLARYHYQGLAAPDGGSFHVGVSAIDGAVITARHPSKLRAGLAKLKGLVGSLGGVFDRAGKAQEPPPAEPPPRGGSVDLKQRFADHVKRERAKR